MVLIISTRKRRKKWSDSRSRTTIRELYPPLMREIGIRSTPSLVFNLQVVSHPLSSSLPSSASSSNSSISADSCLQSNGQSSNSSSSCSNSSPPALLGNGNTLRILSQRSGSTSPSSLDCPSPLSHVKTHILRNIPEWVLVVFSNYFRDQVSTCSRVYFNND